MMKDYRNHLETLRKQAAESALLSAHGDGYAAVIAL